MKLRLSNGSIRFRFTRGEVETLFSGGALEEGVAVGPEPCHQLWYRVIPDDGASNGSRIHASLDGTRLTVTVSPGLVSDWRNGPQPGIEGVQSWPGGGVRILLEKDMQRLNPKPGEEPADVFPNPLFGKKRCDHE